MKKVVISLLLAMALVLSMSVGVFAGDYKNPYIIIKPFTEQAVAK